MSGKMARGCCWADFTLPSVNTPLVPKQRAEWEGERLQEREDALLVHLGARDDFAQPLKTITRALGPRGLCGRARAKERERERGRVGIWGPPHRAIYVCARLSVGVTS